VAPPGTGLPPLAHPAPDDDHPAATCCHASTLASSYHLVSGSVFRRCSHSSAITAWPPSLFQSYPASSVLGSLPTSGRHLFVSLIQIDTTYTSLHNSKRKNVGILGVTLMTGCVTPVGAHSGSLQTARRCAAKSIALGHAQTLGAVILVAWPTGTKFWSFSRSRSQGHL
jgi:hypothetical protein